MGPTLETVVEAEAYWEVHAADALSAVYSIADRLETAAGMHTIRQYLPEVRTMASEGDLNSKAVAIDLTRDVAVAVYAKAHDVVRFEVRYRRNVRATVARNLTGRVGADVIMDRMREDAARRMSRITETLNAMMEAPHFDRQALCDMMAAIHWAGGSNDQAARRLLSPLMNAGAISRTGAGGIASSDVVARLVERGVVEQVRLQHGGTPRYMLTPRFAAVRNALVSALPDCALAAAERQAYRLQ